jgi:hypothetical protein
MDQKTLNEAVENISIIKGIIDRTGKTFVGFSRIFIYWGFLFIINSIFSLYMFANKESILPIMGKIPVLGNMLPTGITAIIAAIIYFTISKKAPLVGLEKHLMKVWMLVLIMNVIPSKISIDTSEVLLDVSKISIQTDRFSIMLFSLAIALITTSMFAGYKQFMYLGCIYIGVSIINAFIRIPLFEATSVQLLFSLFLPFTFLYTGFFLKSRQTRSN